MDLTSRLDRPISAIAAEAKVDRTWLWRVLTGNGNCSPATAIRIESATAGRIRAWELLGLQDGPAPMLPSSDPEAA